ncbi:MAG: hypothetical protein AB1716_08190 [Planctomycetota bacterium]
MADTPPSASPSPETAPSSPEPPPAPATPATPAGEPARPARDTGVHQVSFVSHPKLLFAWPLILAGFLLYYPLGKPAKPVNVAPVVATNQVSGTESAAPAASRPLSTRLEWLGWIYIWVALIVVLALGIDLGRNQSIVLVLVLALVWVTGILLRDKYHLPLLSDIYGWFGRLDVQYDRSMGLALSIILLIPYLFMLIWARLNDRWRITHNEFEHYSLGRSTDSLGRGAKTIRAEFPDFFEFVLGFGAGTLIVYNASGTRELRRIPHVMLLPLVRRKLDLILERTAITAGQFEEEEEEQ